MSPFYIGFKIRSRIYIVAKVYEFVKRMT